MQMRDGDHNQPLLVYRVYNAIGEPTEEASADAGFQFFTGKRKRGDPANGSIQRVQKERAKTRHLAIEPGYTIIHFPICPW